MALQPIPKEWCNCVLAALRRGTSAAHFTKDAGQKWQNEFPSAFRYELDAALVRAFNEAAMVGCPVEMDYPPGTTWEFYFHFQGEKLYGKILLRTDKKSVLILSAHRPRKAKLRCE
jgi:hypothetical protein